jgi:hypothetical protein
MRQRLRRGGEIKRTQAQPGSADRASDPFQKGLLAWPGSEIAQSASEISQLAIENAQGAEEVVEALKVLASLANDLDGVIRQFRLEGKRRAEEYGPASRVRFRSTNCSRHRFDFTQIG